MTNANNAAARYIAAWNERDDSERRALIAATYTDDAYYVDPARSGKGHGGLDKMIASVHRQFPPAYRFRLKGAVDAHNNRARFQWEAGGQSDAPLHFVRGGGAIDSVSLHTFFGRMAKIDARDCAPNEAVGVDRIKVFEATHGVIENGDAVFFHFGWDRFWSELDDHPQFLSDWPGLSREATQYLLARGIRIAGSDCLSLDCFGSVDFPAHKLLLGAGVLIGENFARLGELPAFSFLITLPLPIASGSGAPLRAVAAFAADSRNNPV